MEPQTHIINGQTSLRIFLVSSGAYLRPTLSRGTTTHLVHQTFQAPTDDDSGAC